MPPLIRVVLDRTADFFAALEELHGKSVFVGVPASSARDPSDDGGAQPSNALIGYVMEFGAPEKNIPARPFLAPAIRENQAAITARLKEITKAATDSNIGRIQSLRESLGIFAQRVVKNKISTGPFQPLAEATLRARARRGRKGARAELARRAAGLPAGTEFARPLIDTGQLRQAITYVIGPNKNRAGTIKAMTGEWSPPRGPRT